MNFLLVASGGFVGAIARFCIGLAFNNADSLKPYGTWIANISGSALLGLLFIQLDKGSITETVWLAIGVGFCGAYTTFSTFGTETLAMLLAHQIKKAVVYVASSLLLGLATVFITFSLFN